MATPQTKQLPFSKFASFIEVYLIDVGIGYSVKGRNNQDHPWKGVEIFQRTFIGHVVFLYELSISDHGGMGFVR